MNKSILIAFIFLSGSITCAAYPLSQIDTINNQTGKINKKSALNLVVFGDKDEHLELMDGALIDLLNAKWNTFVKSKFYKQFFLFAFYFSISLICFTLRPGPLANKAVINSTLASNGTINKNIDFHNISFLVNDSLINSTGDLSCKYLIFTSLMYENTVVPRVKNVLGTQIFASIFDFDDSLLR